MTAITEHGLDGYRQGCRCPICTAGKRDSMRAYRARKRGLGEPPPQPGSSVTALPAPAAEVDEPGPIEASVLEEAARLSAAARRPVTVQTALALARSLDDRRLATSHASLARQLSATMTSLREASAGRSGNLASVAALAQRRPTSGVG